jgi:hypothetical protein
MMGEAVTGNWSPQPDYASNIVPPRALDLAYLGRERRRIVLFAELAKAIWITEGERSASLVLGGATLATLVTPQSDLLSKQVAYLRSYSDLRADRIAEINQQIDDLLSFFGAVGFMNDAAREKTMELLALTQDFAIMLEMSAKNFCWTPRPITLEPNVCPIIQTPDHSSFPSGHALEAFAIATVLDRLMSSAPSEGPKAGMHQRRLPFKIAHRIAVNRTIAGVHFPIDNAAGAVFGIALGEAIYALGTGKKPLELQSFAPGHGWLSPEANPDFLLINFYEEFLQNKVELDGAHRAKSDLWAAFWTAAQLEWQ